MPTKRAWIFLILALALYILANQTQVGWVYVITAGLVAILLVAFFYAWGMLKPIRILRTFRNLSASPGPNGGRIGPLEVENPDLTPPTFHEDDPLEATLQFDHTGWRPACLVGGTEFCPCAPEPEQNQPFFIPSLFKGQPAQLSYQTSCDRRGWFQFPDLPLRATDPVGLFKAKHTVAASGEILIYPHYHPLKRLRLLERRGFSQKQASRVGVSNEFIGTREYRPGDSLRQIHWRSTAHRGKLVVKEFAGEDQLTLTVVLDLAHNSSLGQGKFSTFETAIRLAASFGYYATHKNIPFFLIGSNQQQDLPKTALSWWAVLNLLAKVKNDGQKPLSDLLSALPYSPVLVILVSNPSQDIAKALAVRARQDAQVLAIFITPDGIKPEWTSGPGAADLQVRYVSPHTWAEVLAEL